MRTFVILACIVFAVLLAPKEQQASPSPVEPDRTNELILEGTLSAVSVELQEFQSTITTLQAQLQQSRESHARLAVEHAQLVAKLEAQPKVAAKPAYDRSTFARYYVPYLPERNASGNCSNGSCNRGFFGRRR
jgi:hypothetical protein